MNQVLNLKDLLHQNKSKKSQFYKQNKQIEESKRSNILKKEGQRPEYGDPSYVCFKIGQLEFFCKAANYAQHSQYFNKRNQALQMKHEAEEFKDEKSYDMPQIVFRLSKNTYPSILMLVIQHIDQQHSFENLDLDTAFKVVLVADELRMRQLEHELLWTQVVQMINKTNVLDYLSIASRKLEQKRREYRGEIIMVKPDKESDEDEEKKEKKSKSEGGADSDSDSSCEDIDEESNESKRKKEIERPVQIDLPYDEHDNIDELKDSEQNWEEFKNYCIDLAACNLQYIVQMREEDICTKVEPDLVQLIVNKNMYFFRGNPNQDNRSLIELMMRIRGCKSVFELLKLEKDRIIEEELEIRQRELEKNSPKQPMLVWSVHNLTNYFYKQSDSIQIEGAHWRLALSYFKKQSTCLKVDFKIMNSPFDTRQAKEYFKKHEFSVPANLDVEKIDPQAQFEVEEVDTEHQQHRVNQLNAAAANFTNHTFVSFIASVDLFPELPPNPPRIYSMICSQKQPVQLLAVENFDIAKYEYDSISISLQFKLKSMHSQLLCFISKNFTFLLQDPEIRHLSKEEMKLLLKHKYLNVTQEDEVLKAICLWVEGQQIMMKHPRYANVPKKTLQNGYANSESSDSGDDCNYGKGDQSDGSRNFKADLNEVLQNVNWDYVSLPCLLDILRTEPLIRKCESFQQAVKTQFAVRMNRSSQDAIDAAHNQFNCEPRFSYKHNTSQRNLYPNEADLASQNGNKPIYATPGTKSQFQLLYPVQIYPDFMAHLADCMMNPMNIVKSITGGQAMMIGQSMFSHQWSANLQPHSHSGMSSGQSSQSLKENNRRQQDVKKRFLKQQLLKKKLEMKQIQDQINAMEILDVLAENQRSEILVNSKSNRSMNILAQKPPAKQSHFEALAEKIQKAKRIFKLRVANPEKKGEEGQSSDRVHVKAVADDDEESAECSSGNDEPQLEAEEADEEIEEFKVDKQGNHQVRIHRRRLSDVVEDEKKQLKFSNQDKGRKNGRNNRDVDDNALPKDKKNNLLKPIAKRHNSEEKQDESNESFQDGSQVSNEVVSANYSQLQAQRQNWSSGSLQQSVSIDNSNQNESFQFNKSQNDENMQIEDKEKSMRSMGELNRQKEAFKCRITDKKINGQNQFKSEKQGNDVKNQKPFMDADKKVSMEVSFEHGLIMNKSISGSFRDNEQVLEGSAMRESSLSEINTDNDQIREMVRRQYENLVAQGLLENPMIKTTITKEKEIQTELDDPAFLLGQKPDSFEVFSQTEVDMEFMFCLLEQMKEKEILERKLLSVEEKLNKQKSDAINQTDPEPKPSLAEAAVDCNILPRLIHLTQASEVACLEILPEVKAVQVVTEHVTEEKKSVKCPSKPQKKKKADDAQTLNLLDSDSDSSFLNSKDSVSDSSKSSSESAKPADRDGLSGRSDSCEQVESEQNTSSRIENEDSQSQMTLSLPQRSHSEQSPSKKRDDHLSSQTSLQMQDLMKTSKQLQGLTVDIFANIPPSSGKRDSGIRSSDRSSGIKIMKSAELSGLTSSKLDSDEESCSPTVQPIPISSQALSQQNNTIETEQSVTPQNEEEVNVTDSDKKENGNNSTLPIDQVISPRQMLGFAPPSDEPLRSFIEDVQQPQEEELSEKSLASQNVYCEEKDFYSIKIKDPIEKQIEKKGSQVRNTIYQKKTQSPKKIQKKGLPKSKPLQEKFVPSLVKYGRPNTFHDIKSGATAIQPKAPAKNGSNLPNQNEMKIEIKTSMVVTCAPSPKQSKTTKINRSTDLYGLKSTLPLSKQPNTPKLAKYLNKNTVGVAKQASVKPFKRQEQHDLQPTRPLSKTKSRTRKVNAKQPPIMLKIVTEQSSNQVSQDSSQQNIFDLQEESLKEFDPSSKHNSILKIEDNFLMKERVPPNRRIRPQSSLEFVGNKSKLSSLIQPVVVAESLDTSSSESYELSQFSLEKREQMNTMFKHFERHQDNKLNQMLNKKSDPTINSIAREKSPPFRNLSQVLHQQLSFSQKLGPGPGLRDNYSYKMSESKSSVYQLASGRIFTERDQGLACFNILDHLRLGVADKKASVSSRQNLMMASEIINLDRLREEHILKRQQESPNLSQRNVGGLSGLSRSQTHRVKRQH